MPIEAQVKPLPSDETTPPVTKMCFATHCSPRLAVRPRHAARGKCCETCASPREVPQARSSQFHYTCCREGMPPCHAVGEDHAASRRPPCRYSRTKLL